MGIAATTRQFINYGQRWAAGSCAAALPVAQ
jgi:hypothetical protein